MSIAGLGCRILNGLERGLFRRAGQTSGLAKCARIDDLAQALSWVFMFLIVPDSDWSSRGNAIIGAGLDDPND